MGIKEIDRNNLPTTNNSHLCYLSSLLVLSGQLTVTTHACIYMERKINHCSICLLVQITFMYSDSRAVSNVTRKQF